MKAVGEVMSIGKNYKEAFQKAIRSLEIGRHGLGFAKDYNRRPLRELIDLLRCPSSERHFIMYEALRKGASVDQIHEITSVKKWFISQMKELVDLEEEILTCKGKELPSELLIRAKKDGFSDKYLSKILCSGKGHKRAPQIDRVDAGMACGTGERSGKCRLLLLKLQCT